MYVLHPHINFQLIILLPLLSVTFPIVAIHFPPENIFIKECPVELFEAFNAISGTHLILIVFVVPMWTIMYEPRYIFLYTISTFGPPYTIFDELKVSYTQSLDGNLFSKSNTTYISDIVIRLAYLLNSTAWHVALERFLIVNIEC